LEHSGILQSMHSELCIAVPLLKLVLPSSPSTESVSDSDPRSSTTMGIEPALATDEQRAGDFPHAQNVEDRGLNAGSVLIIPSVISGDRGFGDIARLPPSLEVLETKCRGGTTLGGMPGVGDVPFRCTCGSFAFSFTVFH
jgi:hypothetical protein